MRKQSAKRGPNPEDIIHEFFEDILDPEVIEETNFTPWKLPAELQNHPNLPPSLWPITPDSIPNSHFSEWGI